MEFIKIGERYVNVSCIVCIERVKGEYNTCITLVNGIGVLSKSYPKSIINKIEKAGKEATK